MTDLWRRGDNGIVRVISEADFRTTVFEFNHIGSFIWDFIDGDRNVHSIVQGVIAALGTNKEEDCDKIGLDVLKFFKTLEAEHLIEWISC